MLASTQALNADKTAGLATQLQKNGIQEWNQGRDAAKDNLRPLSRLVILRHSDSDQNAGEVLFLPSGVFYRHPSGKKYPFPSIPGQIRVKLEDSPPEIDGGNNTDNKDLMYNIFIAADKRVSGVFGGSEKLVVVEDKIAPVNLDPDAYDYLDDYDDNRFGASSIKTPSWVPPTDAWSAQPLYRYHDKIDGRKMGAAAVATTAPTAHKNGCLSPCLILMIAAVLGLVWLAWSESK